MFQNFTIPTAVYATLLTFLVIFAIHFMFQIAKLGAKYVESKIPAETQIVLKGYASSIVRALNQAPQYTSYDPADKKEYAILYLINQAEKLGYTVLEDAAVSAANSIGLALTRKDLDTMIEEAVADANSELNGFVGLGPATIATPGVIPPAVIVAAAQ